MPVRPSPPVRASSVSALPLGWIRARLFGDKILAPANTNPMAQLREGHPGMDIDVDEKDTVAGDSPLASGSTIYVAQYPIQGDPTRTIARAEPGKQDKEKISKEKDVDGEVGWSDSEGDDAWEGLNPTTRDEFEEDTAGGMSSWSGQSSVKGSSETIRMMLLTFSSVGMTFTWGVEMTYCTPYLLSLGLTKGQTSVVWIAGPLSGLIVQPVIGVISDQSRSKWGRRRPIIAAATAVVVCSLLTLGFTKEIVEFFIADRELAKVPTIALAVLALYATDFAINAVMSCSRSLIVDTLPASKQQSGAAWASRMSSIGNVLGYLMGAIDLVKVLGTTLGDTQFKQLTIIAAAGMLASSAITCWAVTERVLISAKPDTHRGQQGGILKVFHQIYSTLLTLPPRIQAICWAVFWSWIGWYPFLIYSSTWVGETYFRYDVSPEARDSADSLGDMGRIGSMALAVYSIVTFLSAWILPLFIKSPEEEDESFTPRPPASIAPWIERWNKIKPDLLTAWVASHLIYSAAMSLAPFAASFRFATVLVAICGLPWTIAMWAPTTFLGVEVNKLGSNGDGVGASYRRLSVGSSVEMSALSRDRDQQQAAPSAANTGELSGVYFGILNIYTTLPQFIGTFMSTVVFAVLEPGKSPELATDAHPSETSDTDGPNAIAVCLFLGAISTLGAAWATQKLRYIP